MNNVAIIPARGGSKSIPRKNVKLLGGKPLIAYAIDLARSVEQIDRVIVSTDDKEIAEVAKKYGAEVPFMRPAELAEDDTPTLPVIQHSVRFLEDAGYKTDVIVLLSPTCPFLSKESVAKALDFFKDPGCMSVVSVVEDYGRFWIAEGGKYKVLYPKERVNRQLYEPLYRENGAIYFSRYEVMMDQDRVVDDSHLKFLKMNEYDLVDIDLPEDWEAADRKIKGK